MMGIALPINGVFLFGLGLLIVGSAFIRLPSIIMFGQCYEKDDSQRVKGFITLYTLFNCATIFSALLSEKIARSFGWHYGFGFAGITLLCGLFVFYQKRSLVKHLGKEKKPNFLILIFISLIGALCFSWVINNTYFYKYIISYVTIFSFICFIYITLKSKKYKSMIKIFAAITACIISYILIHQLHYSFMLFSKRNINKVVEIYNYSFSITNNMLTMFNSLTIVILGSFINKIWRKLELKNKDPSDIKKL